MSTTSTVTPTSKPTKELPKASVGAAIFNQMAAIVSHRNLLFLLVSRDLSSRYRGSLLGKLWPLLHPLGQLLIYTFVFSIVLKVKFADTSSTGSFAIYFMAGLIPWSIFAESVSRSTTVILENPNLISKVVFPTEILPLVNVFSSFCNQFLASLILLVAATLYLGKLSPTIALLPIVILPLILLASGVSWLLASLGVFVRDTRHIVSLALQAGMYATPILYPAKAVPNNFQWVMVMNPIAGIVEDFRRILLEGQTPDLARFCGYTIFSLLTAFVGLYFFLKTKKSFADVM